MLKLLLRIGEVSIQHLREMVGDRGEQWVGELIDVYDYSNNVITMCSTILTMLMEGYSKKKRLVLKEKLDLNQIEQFKDSTKNQETLMLDNIHKKIDHKPNNSNLRASFGLGKDSDEELEESGNHEKEARPDETREERYRRER